MLALGLDYTSAQGLHPFLGPRRYAPTVILHAASRPADDTTADAHRWSVEGDDYDALMVEVRAAVPAGWVLLSVRRE